MIFAVCVLSEAVEYTGFGSQGTVLESGICEMPGSTSSLVVEPFSFDGRIGSGLVAVW